MLQQFVCKHLDIFLAETTEKFRTEVQLLAGGDVSVSPVQDGLQAGVVQQQVSRLHHLTAAVAQPSPQLLLQTRDRIQSSRSAARSRPKTRHLPLVVEGPRRHGLLQVRNGALVERAQPAEPQHKHLQKFLQERSPPQIFILPAKEAEGVEGGAGCGEDVQEGVDGGGGVAQV